MRLIERGGEGDGVGADGGDRARLQPLAAVAGVDVDRVAGRVAGDGVELDGRRARRDRRQQHAVGADDRVELGVDVSAAGGGVGLRVDVRLAVAERDAERVVAAA